MNAAELGDDANLSLAGTRDRELKHCYQSAYAPVSLCAKSWTWRGQRSEFTLSLRAGRGNGFIPNYLHFYHLVVFST